MISDWKSQVASLGASPRARRSRYAIPASQVYDVFGDDELNEIADAVFRARDRFQCTRKERHMHLMDVQTFLRDELDGAFEFLSHNVDDDLPENSTSFEGATGMWKWQHVSHGLMAKKLAKAIRNMRINNNSKGLREDFFRFVHDRSDVVNTRFEGNLPQNTKDRNEYDEAYKCGQNITEALAWAIIVESVLLNEQLKEDIARISQDPKCSCSEVRDDAMFYLPHPEQVDKDAFKQYVACRWPIHVFAVDPVAQQQNIADTYSLRRETQVALAVAFTSGNLGGNSLTRYMRRIEQDMKTIALNDTVVGFGHGTDTFGWRFYPRFQTPPLESNATVFFRDLIGGGPSRNAQLRKQRIEPGMRECVAIVMMPSFVRHVTFETRSNWFELANCDCTCRANTGPKLLDTVEWSREIQCLNDSVQCALNDAQCYLPGEVDRLMNRAKQLSQRLPMSTLHSPVPYELTLGGFEMFSSGVTDLAPELLGYYGSPGIDPNKTTELFLVGHHFSVRNTRVMAGNKKCEFSMLSRQVMSVKIPAGVNIEYRGNKIDTDRLDKSAASSDNTIGSVRRKPGSKVRTVSHTEVSSESPAGADCSEAYVEVRLATPYGVTGQLHIPVIKPQECKPSLNWTQENFALTYFWSPGTGASAAAYSVADTDVVAKGKFRFAVKIPENVVVSGTAKGTLNITLVGDSIGVSGIVPITGLPFDPRKRQYYIDGANFGTLHTNVKNAVVNGLLKSSPKTPPDSTVVKFVASLVLDDGTEIDLSNELALVITFTQK